MHLTAAFRNDRLRSWVVLAAVQAAVALVLFHDFLSGEKYFAFMDVGSDTFGLFVPTLIHLASPANWSSAWSFNVGLGGLAPPFPNPFTLLGIAGGPQHVLDLRIWVYLAKIFVGGAAFHGFALAIGARRDVARIVAVAYSFCGYIATDGQWDPSASEFAAYAVVLWALARHSSHPGNAWLIPFSIAFAAYSGAFMFSVGVFIVYVFIAACIASDRPGATARTWIASILPQCAIGLMLAAPVLVPTIFQLLDSPRIAGPQSSFGARLGELLSLNDETTVLVQLAGLFHKNMLGVGSRNFGWMNYFESPGFYVGMLPLLLIPQLCRGTRADRRILVAGAIALGLFVLVPAIRYAAFGFGLDYFRVNNLWVSMLLLSLFAAALGVIAQRGVDGRVLAGTVLVLAIVLANIQTGLFPRPSLEHEWRIAAFGGAGLILLALMAWRGLAWPRFAAAALLLVAAESAVVNYPSFHDQREVVTRETPGYYDDGTMGMLAFLKSRDPGFHRIEKTYDSVSFCDAMAQDYMGVKSYWFQSAGVVGFYTGLELIPKRSRVKNYTNWLPNFGARFVLNTLAGVKYLIADKPLDWPGFRRIHAAGRLTVYENDLALPLAVVHAQQYPRERIGQLSPQARDMTMINAVIVDQLRGDSPLVYDAQRLTKQGPAWLEENYVLPAKLLRSRGLAIDTFSPGKVAGTIRSDAPGILVFAIPFAKGWSVAVDGVNQPVFSAQLGMLAVDIAAGPHRVEARYAVPGLIPGLLIGVLGLLALGVLSAARRRTPDPVMKA